MKWREADMDVRLGFVGHGCPSKPLAIYSIMNETLNSVGAACGFPKGGLLVNFPLGCVIRSITTL
ncbi:MAG: hypothetical protein ACPGUD_12465 [Parashewanella sp.]